MARTVSSLVTYNMLSHLSLDLRVYNQTLQFAHTSMTYDVHKTTISYHTLYYYEL